MKYPNAPILLSLLLCALPGVADEVTLKSGAVLQGRILSENAHELTLEVARTADSGIRTQKIILHSAVDRVQRGAPKVRIVEETGSTDPGVPETLVTTDTEGAQLSSADQRLLHKLKESLQTSVGLVSDGHYDRAIQTYSLVSKHHSLLDMEKRGGIPAMESLKIREESHRMWGAAIDGKIEYNEELIDQREEQVEELVDQAEENLRRYEDEQDDGRRRNRDEKVVVKMRRGNNPPTPVDQKLETFKARLAQAKETEQRFKEWEKETSLANRNLEAEAKIIKEAHKQIREELSDIERGRGRRR